MPGSWFSQVVGWAHGMDESFGDDIAHPASVAPARRAIKPNASFWEEVMLAREDTAQDGRGKP